MLFDILQDQKDPLSAAVPKEDTPSAHPPLASGNTADISDAMGKASRYL